MFPFLRSRRWALVGLGVISLAFSIATIKTCDFISLERTADINLISGGFGLFQSDVGGICIDYPDRAGGAHAIAKAFSMLAVVAIGLAVICCLMGTLCLKDSRAKIALYSARALFAGGLYSVLFTFFMYASPLKRSLCAVEGVGCKAGPGAIMAAVNSVVLAGLVLLSMRTSAPQSQQRLNGKTHDPTTTERDNDPEDEEAGSTATWFSSNAKTTPEQSSNVDAVVSPSGKKQRGWFRSRGIVAAAGAGGAAAVVAARPLVKSGEGDNDKSQRSLFGKSSSSKNTVSEPIVMEEAEEEPDCGWFGSSSKNVVTEPVIVQEATEEPKRRWFGAKGKVASAAVSTSAIAAGYDDEEKSKRSLFGNKTKKARSESCLKNLSTMAVTSETDAEPLKRSGLGALFRSDKSKSSPNTMTTTVVDDLTVVSNHAETRRALFGSDAESVSTAPEPVLTRTMSNNKRAETTAKQQEEQNMTVVNDSVSSTCPPCYCMP
jgi:hypothetical protein